MPFNNRRDFPSDSLTTTEVIWVQTGTSGIFLLKEGTAPSTIANYAQLYAKSSDHQLYWKSSAGTENLIASGFSDAPSDGSIYGRRNAAWAATTGGGSSELTWLHQTGTTLQLDNSSNIYINIGADNAGLVTITLPTNANSTAGKTFSVIAMGAGGWKIAQNALQKIHFGNQNTTTGVTGYLSSSNQYDSLKLICTIGDGASNAEWAVISSVGNITVA